MSAPVYLGDEVSAAGYRLAGALVCTPAAGEAAAALTPLVSIVPDLRGDAAVPDIGARLRAQLGLEA